MNSKVGIDKASGQLLPDDAKNKSVDATKPPAQTSAKSQTAASEIWPVGRCRVAVRGFAASYRRSAIRLNAIAVLRANTMHMRMPSKSRPNSWYENGSSRHLSRQANAALVSANGKAKTVWLKRINSNRRRKRANMEGCR